MDTGVYVGIQQMEYGGLAAPFLHTIGPFSATGGSFSVAAGRLSFTYGLKVRLGGSLCLSIPATSVAGMLMLMLVDEHATSMSLPATRGACHLVAPCASVACLPPLCCEHHDCCHVPCPALRSQRPHQAELLIVAELLTPPCLALAGCRARPSRSTPLAPLLWWPPTWVCCYCAARVGAQPRATR